MCLTCQVIDRSGNKYEPVYRDPRRPWGKSEVLVRIFTLETIKYEKDKKQAVEPD
jgi:hypothetical protein